MALKGEASLTGSLAVAALVYSIYSGALPSIADTRTSAYNDPDLASTEQAAAWASAGVVAGISLLTRDPRIFVTGGAMLIGMSWWHKHANQVNPMTGKASGNTLSAVPDMPAPDAASA